MKLKALDQIHVSSVQADTLRAGQEFNISDVAGEELLARHPGVFKQLAEAETAAAPAAKKAAAAAKNKMAVEPNNKSGN